MINRLRYVDNAQKALARIQSMMAHYPPGFGQWLQALSDALSKPQGTAIVGKPEAAKTQALPRIVRGDYRLLRVVALGVPDPLRSRCDIMKAALERGPSSFGEIGG